MACKCEKQEVGTGLGSVKGFITTKECAECKAKREADNAVMAIKDAELKAKQEEDALVKAKLEEMAKAELVKEGKLKEE